MSALILLALAVAPGLAIAIFIYWKDKFEKEPKRLLIISFILGMVSILPAILLEGAGQMLGFNGSGSMITTAVYAFIVVGLSEEGSKFFFLRIYPYRQKDFNEPFDGITYAVMVSMGFATVENIFYVFEFGPGNALIRMFTAVPAHATFGVIMGYYVGLAKFSRNPAANFFRALFFAALMHGAYDFFLMVGNVPLMASGALISLYLGVRYSLRAIKLHQQQSPFQSHSVAEENSEV